jgi:hypothetical protein
MVKKMSVPNATDTGFSESANNLSTPNPSYIISKRLFDIAFILFFTPVIIPNLCC